MSGVVAYYRVSTQEQGRSGLGMEAQQSAVRRFTEQAGHEIIREFAEIESGKRSDRPQLARAIELCELSGAQLVIAKLDRLARNVHFISSLMESGIHFTAVDMPQANNFTVHVMAALSEQERKLISERTKAALKIKKEQGHKLGNPKIAEARAARKNGSDMTVANEARSKAARDFANIVRGEIEEAVKKGASSLREVAQHLNDMGARTRQKKLWTAAAVKRVLVHLDTDLERLKAMQKSLVEQELPDHYGAW